MTKSDIQTKKLCLNNPSAEKLSLQKNCLYRKAVPTEKLKEVIRIKWFNDYRMNTEMNTNVIEHERSERAEKKYIKKNI